MNDEMTPPPIDPDLILADTVPYSIHLSMKERNKKINMSINAETLNRHSTISGRKKKQLLKTSRITSPLQLPGTGDGGTKARFVSKLVDSVSLL